MAGIYLHIPFCKQACHYCNFHFSTSLRYKTEMIDALVQELQLQKDYLSGETIETIYFGGGTPSLLDTVDLERLFTTIQKLHTVADDAEVTLEANPDDLTREKLRTLRATPVNRLSIGIQSFFEEDLRFMNRAHSAREALDCVHLAREMDFEQLTIDLIYGSPTTTDARWAENLDMACELDIPHLSSYCLTVEPGTALDHFVRKKRVPPVDEEQAARQFEMLIERTEAAEYVHYEISNFAKKDRYSRHNSAYWQGKSYLGIGPSAHSFNGKARQWNVAHNMQYIKAIQTQRVPSEEEILTPAMRYDEYILTALRTIWGSDLQYIEALGASFASHFLEQVEPYLRNGQVERDGNIFRLTKAGKLLADHISVQLFFDDEPDGA